METTYLLLSDGFRCQGLGFGAVPPLASQQTHTFPIGEIVFNTSMTGYPEILTDPSYNGQMVLMTYPLIGNYGVDEEWNESNGIKATALAVKELYTGPLPPGRKSLDEWMKENGVPGITGIDTRALTLHLRQHGAQNAILYRGEDHERAAKALAAFPKIYERDLIDGVSVKEKVTNPVLGPGFAKAPERAEKHFALVDFGIKRSIIENFYKRGIAITLYPPTVTSAEILSSHPSLLFLSNGPGDPALLSGAVKMTKECIGHLPVAGICLGHQIITWALGGRTVKMKFGHHGGNHPVKDLDTGKTFVTAQNHGFMSDPDSLPEGVHIWFENANDHSIEGLYDTQKGVRSVQFHPEACPGPRDVEWIFDAFIKEAN